MTLRILLAVLMVAGAGDALARTVIDDWATVAVPPAPALAPVTLDPKTTALLLLDFNGHGESTSGPCNEATKPRCLASLPAVRALADRARAKGVLVVYSTMSRPTSPGRTTDS